MQFIANIFFKGKIKCLTGLHIGGGQDKLEIGGVDSIVIRDPRTQYPIIPGSSLRGKLRTMIEFGLGKISMEKNKEGEPSLASEIVRIFGKGADDGRTTTIGDGPTRLLVRDCMPDTTTTAMWEEIETELLYTEFKAENTINRLTSAANPRFIERVPSGSVFDFELILGVYGSTTTLKEDITNIIMGLGMIEHNWLGKSGSRGYGKIEFVLNEPALITCDDYKTNPTKCKDASKQTDEALTLADFDQKKIEKIISTLSSKS